MRLVVFFILISVQCFSQPVVDFLDKEGIKGPVKSFDQIRIDAPGNGDSYSEDFIKKHGVQTKTYKFNQQRQLAAEIINNAKEGDVQNSEYSYDEKGRLSKCMYYMRGQSSGYTHIYYNASDSMMSYCELYTPKDTMACSFYYRDSLQRVYLHVRRGARHFNVLEKHYYLYNKQGWVTAENYWYRDTDYKRKFVHDASGRIITIDDWHGIRKFTYDTKGRLLSDIQYNTDKLIFGKDVFKYNENGKKVEHDYYMGNPLNSKKVFDKDGKVTVEFFYKKSGGIEGKNTYSYETDKYGNWTSQKCYYNDKLDYTFVRKITYY